MKAAVGFLAVVALALSVDAAAYFDGNRLTIGDSGLTKVWNNVLAHSSSAPSIVNANTQDKEPLVLVEYAVPPPVGKLFVESFQKLEVALKNATGVQIFALIRTIDDNLSYYLYSRFDSRQALADLKDSVPFKLFGDAISSLGVVYKTHSLKELSVNNSTRVQGIFEQAALSANTSDKRPLVLTEYAVPPPVGKQFVETFLQLEAHLNDVKGVETIGLSRTIDDNLVYYVYTQFVSRQAYAEHKDSAPVKDFVKAINQLAVVYKTHPLKPIVVKPIKP